MRLLERFPALRDHCSPLQLTRDLPTPVEHLSGLAKAWGIPNLYVKRDDRTSSLYGGNKVRKLEWILGAAKARGARSVITTGAWGSHHALATAVFSREVGLRATLVLAAQPPTSHVLENLNASSSIAKVVKTRSFVRAPFVVARECVRSWRAGRGWPASVPPGGSSATGVLGYVEGGLELAAQIASGAAPVPDYIFVAVGTCGTLAGLGLGLALAAAEQPALARVRLVGVGVVPSFLASPRRVRSLQRGALRILKRAGARLRAAALAPVEIVGTQLGDGYGHATGAAIAAQKAAREADQLDVETTYTAKALAGLREFATTDPHRKEATFLYVHTLGSLNTSP